MTVGEESVQVEALVTVAEMVTDPFFVVTVAGDAARWAIFGLVVAAPAAVARPSAPTRVDATIASALSVETAVRDVFARPVTIPARTLAMRLVWTTDTLLPPPVCEQTVRPEGGDPPLS